MIGHSLSFSCLKKKGLAYGDFEGRIRPEANCSSTQRFISTISCRVSEYSLEVRCPGSVLNSILISKSGREQGSSSHFASLKTDGYRLGQSGVGPDLEKRVSGILAEARVLAFGGVGWQCGREVQVLGQRESFTSAFAQSISGLCRFNQSCPRITMWDWVFPSRKWIRSWWSPTLTSKSMPNRIFPSLFCIPSTLYIVIGFCRGAGSSPTLFAHSKSINQLGQPGSIRASEVAPFAVLRASRCTWMESSHGMRDSASFSTFVRRFIGPTFLLATVSFLSFSSTSIRVCLHCKIVYFGVLAVDTGTGRGLGYLHPRRQFGLTGPRLQNPAPQQEPFSLSRTTPGSPGAMQSHSRSLQDYDLGFPWRGPAASGSAGACLGGGTLRPCGLPGHIRNRCAPLQGHERDPPPWHHQHWWEHGMEGGAGVRASGW